MATVEWKYRPNDFFKRGKVVPVKGDLQVAFDNGTARLVLSEECLSDKLLNAIFDELRAAFQFQVVISNQTYEFTAGRAVTYQDGRRAVTTAPFRARTGIRVHGRMEVRRGSNWTIADERLPDLAVRYKSNPTVAVILASYESAIRDPQHTFIHLYEVRDALVRYFVGEANAQSALSVSATKWKRFGVLANVLPLQEGRHRGKSVGQLRKATISELSAGRDFARKLIVSFLEYLDANKNPQLA